MGWIDAIAMNGAMWTGTLPMASSLLVAWLPAGLLVSALAIMLSVRQPKRRPVAPLRVGGPVAVH